LEIGADSFWSGDYQFARRWFFGARLDQSDRADAARLRDKAARYF